MQAAQFQVLEDFFCAGDLIAGLLVAFLLLEEEEEKVDDDSDFIMMVSPDFKKVEIKAVPSAVVGRGGYPHKRMKSDLI